MIVSMGRLSGDDSEMGRAAARRTCFGERVALIVTDLSRPDEEKIKEDPADPA